jgi:hypothetical protein
MAQRWSHNLEPTVSGHLRNRIFRPSKWRRVNHRKQDTLDPIISWPLKNNIFKWSKCLRGRHEYLWVTQRSKITLIRESHEPWRITFSRSQKEAIYPGVEDLRQEIFTNNYGGKMHKIFIFFQDFKISKFRKFKKFWSHIFGPLRSEFWNCFVAWGLTTFLLRDISITWLESFFTVMLKCLTTCTKCRVENSWYNTHDPCSTAFSLCRHESLFQAANMTKSCSSETMYSSAKSLMNLEEFHFQATERPNRGFVNARYLCDDRWSHETWVIAFSGRKNVINIFAGSLVPLRTGSHTSTGIAF